MGKKNNGILDNMQNTTLTALYVITGITALLIIIILYILYYLNNLRKCKCYLENTKKESNIRFLIIIELIILFSYLILLFVSIYGLYTFNDIIDTISSSNKKISNTLNKNSLEIDNSSIANKIFIFILIIINLYFVFNVYKLSKNIEKKCECSHRFIRYILYIQSFIMLINTIFLGAVLFKN